jgi:hypothetical protein
MAHIFCSACQWESFIMMLGVIQMLGRPPPWMDKTIDADSDTSIAQHSQKLNQCGCQGWMGDFKIINAVFEPLEGREGWFLAVASGPSQKIVNINFKPVQQFPAFFINAAGFLNFVMKLLKQTTKILVIHGLYLVISNRVNVGKQAIRNVAIFIVHQATAFGLFFLQYPGRFRNIILNHKAGIKNLIPAYGCE